MTDEAWAGIQVAGAWPAAGSARRIRVDSSLDVVEEQVGNFDLDRLHLRHVVQEQRVIRGGLEGEGSASEESVVEVFLDLNVGDTGERQVMSGAREDARAGDDPLRRDRVGGR